MDKYKAYVIQYVVQLFFKYFIDLDTFYGARIVVALGKQLELEFGRGFSEKSLRHMIRFAEVFPNEFNCLSTAETIELDAFYSHHLYRRLTQA